MVTEPSARLLNNVPRMATWPLAKALGQRMLAAARDGDWERALKILSERNSVLQTFFSTEVREDEAEAVAESIRDTLAVDDELRRLSDLGRADLQGKLRGLKTGRKARQAYLSGP